MEVISLKDVSKKLEGKQILDKLSLSVEEGDIFGIFGPNGCGKSVLIKLMIGFFKPDSGSVSVASRIGFSMQHNSFYDSLTLEENLKYFANIYSIKNKKEKIEELLGKLFLSTYRKRPVAELSGGTKKRADIACALLNDPEILILDEPFTGLDHFLVKQLIFFLQELRKGGKTIVLSTHDLAKVEEFCTKFTYMQDGKAILINKAQFMQIYSQ